MLKAISVFFDSIGVHPVLGGFLLGVLFCVALYVVKRFLGIEIKSANDDELARFRDPNAFTAGSSIGSTVTTQLSFKSDSQEHVLPDHISAQVMGALHKGNKIEAIKIFKDATGLGLKESKDIVEALQRNIVK